MQEHTSNLAKCVAGAILATEEHGTHCHFEVGPVWFAPIPRILFNAPADHQMANEPFSRALLDGELEFSGLNLLDPKEERFDFSGQAGRAGFG